MIGQQPEMTTLREDGGFVVGRAVLEAKHKPRGHPIAASVLNQIAARQHGSVERAQRKETVHQTFGMSYGHGFCGRFGWPEQCGAGEQRDEDVRPTLVSASSHPAVTCKSDSLFAAAELCANPKDGVDHAIDVVTCAVIVDDARAQDEAPTEFGARQKLLAAELQPLEQLSVDRIQRV